MSSMEGRVALITGGGSGIGEAIAKRFAREGVRVALVGRRKDRLGEVATLIRAAGGEALEVPGDITQGGLAKEMVGRVEEAWGQLDLLVQNAALYQPQPVLETSQAGFEQHFETNVFAPFALARASHDLLKKSGKGVVLSILSTLAHRPVAGSAAYAASKAAQLSLHHSLALEWAPDGIRSVAISPGVVDTPLHGKETLESMGPVHPLGRCGSVEEIAEAAHFLCCDLSGWTTGAVLRVDGGIHLS